MDKSHVHKLIGSIKELSKCSEGRLSPYTHHIGTGYGHTLYTTFTTLTLTRHVWSHPSLTAHGASMKNVAEDLVKFGTTISTAEALLGKWVVTGLIPTMTEVCTVLVAPC